MPETLGQLRRRFTKEIALLVIYIDAIPGQEAMLEDGKCKTGHKVNSNHYIGLAQDISLFIGGVYQTDTEAYRSIGQHWKSMGADHRWGGDFPGDGNHFSFEYKGRA